MNIKKINLEDTGNLNESQKYFCERIQQFAQGLDEQYFDINDSVIKIENVKNKVVFKITLIPKEKNNIGISMYFTSIGIDIFIEGWDEHIPYTKFSQEQLYKKIEEFLKFILSQSCKMQILKINNKPYKWKLYSFEDDAWKFYSMTGSVIYNFLGKKTTEEKQSSLFAKMNYPKELFAE